MDQKVNRELLLRCLRVGEDEPKISDFEHLSADEWDIIALESVKGNVSALLYHILKRSGVHNCVPTRIMQTLEEIYLQTALDNTRIYNDFSELIIALRKERIPAIALKGIMLAELVYGNLALRPMNDIDLLLREHDLHRADKVLLEHGYAVRSYPRGVKWTKEGEQHLPAYEKTRGAHDIKIEIHWSINPGSGLSPVKMSDIWDRAEQVRIAGAEVMIMSPEDLLLYLCIHISPQHRFAVDLRHIYDIREVIRNYRGSFSWEKFVSIVKNYSISKQVHLPLVLARRMIKADVPDIAINGLQPGSFDPDLIDRAEERVFSDARIPITIAKTASRIKPGARFRSALKYMFPARCNIAARSGITESSMLIYPLYIVHHLNFLRRRWSLFLRLIRRDRDMVSELDLDRWILQ